MICFFYHAYLLCFTFICILKICSFPCKDKVAYFALVSILFLHVQNQLDFGVDCKITFFAFHFNHGAQFCVSENHLVEILPIGIVDNC